MTLLRIRVVMGLAALLSAGAAYGQASAPMDMMPDEALHGWTRIPWTALEPLQAKMQWKADTTEHTLLCTGDGGHEWLRNDKELGDYILQVDWRMTPKGPEETKYNSGIGVRLSQYGELWVQAQTQLAGGYLFGMNLVDGVLGRFNLMKEMKENRVKPAGEWNHYEIRVEGPRITLAVNGAVVSEVNNIALRKGYFALEAEHYEVTFRNIKVQTLP